jgi:conjugal transfer pilus assembly protein TrbC
MIALGLAALLAVSPLDAEASCRGCAKTAPQKKENLLVFMSFSVPLQTWKDYSDQMKKTGGVFLLRGIPGQSFGELSLKIVELRRAGIYAPIDIDPDLFSEYRIETVPSIVLRERKKYDKIEGNIRIDAALRMIAESGDLSEKAQKLLETVE